MIAIVVIAAVVGTIAALVAAVVAVVTTPAPRPRHRRRFEPGDLDISRLDLMDGVGRRDEP